jgi:hypothetical protein
MANQDVASLQKQVSPEEPSQCDVDQKRHRRREKRSRHDAPGNVVPLVRIDRIPQLKGRYSQVHQHQHVYHENVGEHGGESRHVSEIVFAGGQLPSVEAITAPERVEYAALSFLFSRKLLQVHLPLFLDGQPSLHSEVPLRSFLHVVHDHVLATPVDFL